MYAYLFVCVCVCVCVHAYVWCVRVCVRACVFLSVRVRVRLRFHDVRGGASVCRMGPFLRHASFPDHVGPSGTEQGQHFEGQTKFLVDFTHIGLDLSFPSKWRIAHSPSYVQLFEGKTGFLETEIAHSGD